MSGLLHKGMELRTRGLPEHVQRPNRQVARGARYTLNPPTRTYKRSPLPLIAALVASAAVLFLAAFLVVGVSDDSSTLFDGAPGTAQSSTPADLSSGEEANAIEWSESEPADAESLPTDSGTLESPISAMLETLTIEQKIGQRFITWVEGKTVTTETERMIRDGFVGGVILYPWNIDSSDQVRTLINDLQAVAAGNDPAIDLFVSVDREGGRVSAVRLDDAVRLPAAHHWAQHDDEEFVSAAAYLVSRELRSLGFNMNFAPVLDLYAEPDSTIIGDRSFGADPETVGRYGIRYIDSAERAGVIPVVKHFPGHGVTTVDSHGALPVVDKDTDLLRNGALKPFVTAIEHGAPAIMTAHILFTALDAEFPATLSEPILKDLLRDELGFDGVVVSDGMSMRALSAHYSVRESIKRMFHAEVDIMLAHNEYDVLELIDIAIELYRDGEITREQIETGARRVLELKHERNLLPS